MPPACGKTTFPSYEVGGEMGGWDGSVKVSE